MGLLQNDSLPPLDDVGPVAVLAPEGADGLFAAAIVALAWADRRPTVLWVHEPGGESGGEPTHPWARSVAEWWSDQTAPVAVRAWDGMSVDGAAHVVVAGTVGLLTGPLPACDRVAVLGVPPADEAALAEALAVGAVLAVEHVPRFGAVGRMFVELVEHVHHVSGPSGQSTEADVLRASLFGRRGHIPVNLATREAPRRVGPEQTLVWWLDPSRLA